MTYKCTVCGYKEMVSPPNNHNICPCCGTEFGYDDSTLSEEELRMEWIEGGARWFSQTNRAPVGWNPMVQLARSGYLPNWQKTSVSTFRTAERSFDDGSTTAATLVLYSQTASNFPNLNIITDSSTNLSTIDAADGDLKISASGSGIITIDAAHQLLITNLPTSPSGLPTGALWNNLGVLSIA